ncbi:MAG: DUF1543 domain-containing protein [Sphingobacteriales bacterium]|nr:MAG: DUF1543 domain-containing protein [Sphingobacteriales bacterium]
MLLLGCRPQGRLTEQHDMFFGIAGDLKELIPDIKAFWPEAKGNIHIDAWREVNTVDGFQISVVEKKETVTNDTKLFFINLGGYKPGEFEEYHYKMLVAARDKEAAIRMSKQTTFFKHTGFKGATAHVDDKYGVDVDDLYEINDILHEKYKEQYSIFLSPADYMAEDELHLGYLPLYKI